MKNIAISDEINSMTKIFGWMAVGLSVSGITAFKLFQNYYLVQSVIENYFILGILVLGFIGFVVWISLNIEQMDASKITLLFFGFSILNGLISPLIFQFFTQNFIISTFFILAGMFLVMGVCGYIFKQDLIAWLNLFFLALIGIILNFILNFLWRKDQFQLIASAIAIIVFVGITAYSSRKIKEMNEANNAKKAIVLGAFVLSLNLFYLFIAMVFEVNKGSKRING